MNNKGMHFNIANLQDILIHFLSYFNYNFNNSVVYLCSFKIPLAGNLKMHPMLKR